MSEALIQMEDIKKEALIGDRVIVSRKPGRGCTVDGILKRVHRTKKGAVSYLHLRTDEGLLRIHVNHIESVELGSMVEALLREYVGFEPKDDKNWLEHLRK